MKCSCNTPLAYFEVVERQVLDGPTYAHFVEGGVVHPGALVHDEAA